MITILHGDNLDLLPTLEPASVQAIVTSPPYFGLRNYGIPPSVWPAIAYAPLAGLADVEIPAQTVCLGLESDPLAYIGHLVHVFRLARPALGADGVLLLNLGDSYAGGNQTGRNDGGRPEKDRGWATYDIKQTKLDRVDGVAPKNLLCIPHRAALALQADGWYLRADCIWYKSNAMPESVKDRPTRAHEYVFLLAKSDRYFWNADAVSEPAIATKNRGGAQKMQSQVSGAGAKNDGFGSRFDPKPTRNLRSVWTIATKPLSDAHYAPMPESLADLCIKASTKPGDTVLDMYGGSGTTSRAAERLQRNAIHMDLAYHDIANRRTDGIQVEMPL